MVTGEAADQRRSTTGTAPLTSSCIENCGMVRCRILI